MVLREIWDDGDPGPVSDLFPKPAELPDVSDNLLAESDSAPAMRVLYLNQAGRSLEVRNAAFTVEEESQEIIAIPHQRVDRIEVGPHCVASDPALRHALATSTEVAFVNGWGETLGTLQATVAPRAQLHLDQARHAIDHELRVELATKFVTGRLRNQRALLHRLNRRRKDEKVARAINGITKCIRKLRICRDIPSLMGVEGEAAAHYWPAWGRTLEHGWKFRKRIRRPPPDPVNLLLSFSAALLMRDISVLLERHGLHGGFGVLHATQDGRPTCSLDVIEEFRAPLSEGLVTYVLNNRILKREMFQRSKTEGCRIHPEGRKALLRSYEDWLRRDVQSPHSGHQIPWRRLVEEQVLALIRHLRDQEPYHPYDMKY